MKPSFMQNFFARHWPLKILLAAVALGSAFLAGRACEPRWSSWHDWSYLLLFASVIIVAPVFACYSSLLFVWFLLSPFYEIRGRMNGAPFQPGDYVQVLVGPNRGRIFPVDEIWPSRGQVCLELGEPRKKGVQFAFTHTQVCRVTRPEKTLSTAKI